MTNTSEAPEAMKYGNGDTITIMRGIHRGKAAKVIGVDQAKRQYATTLVDGSFLVVNEVNTKAPVEGQVTAGKLAEILKGLPEDAGIKEFASVLATSVDGFAEAYDAE